MNYSTKLSLINFSWEILTHTLPNHFWHEVPKQMLKKFPYTGFISEKIFVRRPCTGLLFNNYFLSEMPQSILQDTITPSACPQKVTEICWNQNFDIKLYLKGAPAMPSIKLRTLQICTRNFFIQTLSKSFLTWSWMYPSIKSKIKIFQNLF